MLAFDERTKEKKWNDSRSDRLLLSKCCVNTQNVGIRQMCGRDKNAERIQNKKELFVLKLFVCRRCELPLPLKSSRFTEGQSKAYSKNMHIYIQPSVHQTHTQLLAHILHCNGTTRRSKLCMFNSFLELSVLRFVEQRKQQST